MADSWVQSIRTKVDFVGNQAPIHSTPPSLRTNEELTSTAGELERRARAPKPFIYLDPSLQNQVSQDLTDGFKSFEKVIHEAVQGVLESMAVSTLSLLPDVGPLAPTDPMVREIIGQLAPEDIRRVQEGVTQEINELRKQMAAEEKPAEGSLEHRIWSQGVSERSGLKGITAEDLNGAFDSLEEEFGFLPEQGEVLASTQEIIVQGKQKMMEGKEAFREFYSERVTTTTTVLCRSEDISGDSRRRLAEVGVVNSPYMERVEKAEKRFKQVLENKMVLIYDRKNLEHSALVRQTVKKTGDAILGHYSKTKDKLSPRHCMEKFDDSIRQERIEQGEDPEVVARDLDEIHELYSEELEEVWAEYIDAAAELYDAVEIVVQSYYTHIFVLVLDLMNQMAEKGYEKQQELNAYYALIEEEIKNQDILRQAIAGQERYREVLNAFIKNASIQTGLENRHNQKEFEQEKKIDGEIREEYFARSEETDYQSYQYGEEIKDKTDRNREEQLFKDLGLRIT